MSGMRRMRIIVAMLIMALVGTALPAAAKKMVPKVDNFIFFVDATDIGTLRSAIASSYGDQVRLDQWRTKRSSADGASDPEDERAAVVAGSDMD